ncbi:ferritin-like domain-containing protein [uncultured Chloroflexus sp.]|uniref:ferritin-like domain-containing protein n=1 Tax=uncultured Chloroflexus sp. TaxID=214040 RepID=UPI00260FCD37|nr:ferritin-like domain-containing protein [uncultured Chloroflexus sp.]
MTAEHTQQSVFSRRSLIKGVAGLGGGLVVASFANLFGVRPASASGHDRKDEPQLILNLAATAETLATTFYYAALTAAKFRLDDEDVLYLKLALDAEKYHLDFLVSNGGRALTNQFYVPANLLSDPALFVQVGADAETAFVGAYLAATRRFAELGLDRIAGTTAQHACSEAQHLALIREIGGFAPNNLALPLPIYYNVSDAVPTLAPFLQGGQGFIGPVSAPSAAQITAVLGNVKSDPTQPYTKVF